jgi:glycosyltransferase involved in cell wall biosynthesis
MSDRDGARLRVAMVSYDFGEVCVPMARALSRVVDIALALPRRELEPVDQDVDPAVLLKTFQKPRLRQPVQQVALCRDIVRFVREVNPDVLHVQQGHLWFNLAGLPLLADVRLVVTIHDATPHLGDRGGRKTPQAIMDIAFRRADQLIVHAEQLKRDVVGRLGREQDAVHVVPHIALGRAHSDPVAEHPSSVLFFGRIWPYKGLEYLLRAEPLITQRVPDVRFVIAGQGEDFGRYRAMMRDPSRFTVHNEFVSAERRAHLFDEAALVVLPYVEASQSGVVPVAYEHQKPVVATAVGGLPEAVEDGRTGLIVPPRDERALADAVVTLLRDPALRRGMGAAGRRKLQREASADSVAARTLPVYELAVRGADGRPCARV